MPERILDLFAEFRNHTNMDTKADQARRTPSGAGLLGALIYFGLDPMDAAEKKEMQEAIGNGTWQGRYTRRRFSTIARRTWRRSSGCCR